jgi:L-fuconolactonase
MPTIPRIDAHQHFWRYTPEEYGWISADMNVLRKDFGPLDLKPLLERSNIAGTIAVQARQTLEETSWLLQLTSEHSYVQAVVGWAPLQSRDVADTVAALRANPHLKGLRHLVQDEPDDDYILSPAFNRGVRALRGTGLVYDILIHTRHLPQTIRFVDRHPDQTFVLDHCAKPPLRSGHLEFWSTSICELAKRPNICCKVSGLVTEADVRHWSVQELKPCWDIVLEAFGPGRLLFGSDWPVLLLASPYQRWVETMIEWTSFLSADESEQIWGGTARRVYSLR